MRNKDLENLFNTHFKKIFCFFYYKTFSKAISEDLTSDTFLELAECIRKTNIDNIEAYLYGIAKHIFYDYLSSKKDTFPIDDEEMYSNNKDIEDFQIDDLVEEVYSRNLYPLINLLPSKQKRIIELFYVENNTLSEVCKILGKNINYVKTTKKKSY